MAAPLLSVEVTRSQLCKVEKLSVEARDLLVSMRNYPGVVGQYRIMFRDKIRELKALVAQLPEEPS
jgi:hypothetical protein